MVIRGATRGGAKQLATYLVTKAENERIRILDVNGRSNPNKQDLFDALFSMGLTEKLTKSKKGLYHAQINPAIEESRLMTEEQWFEAADMLGKELGLEDQRRVIVLHEKNSRYHAHVVFERYDHEKGIMRSDSYSRLAQDRARQEMELVFEHKQTPKRNKHRPELKASLSALWKQSVSGVHFVNAARDNGYLITMGSGRQAFGVVDIHGRSYNLVRQLGGVKTKEVRERLEGLSLIGEKAAIGMVRSQQKEKAAKETEQLSKVQDAINRQQKEQFNQNATAISENQNKAEQHHQNQKDEFANNKDDMQLREEAFRKRYEELDRQTNRNRDKGLEYD